MDIAQRAALSLARTRVADPQIDHLTSDAPWWAHRANLVRTLCAALGVDPVDVVVSPDPIRNYGNHTGYLVTLHDGATTYQFIPELGVLGVYLLLRPCLGCGRDVPHAAISSLVDLGRFLEGQPGTDALATRYLGWDPAHATNCQFRAPAS